MEPGTWDGMCSLWLQRPALCGIGAGPGRLRAAHKLDWLMLLPGSCKEQGRQWLEEVTTSGPRGAVQRWRPRR